MCSHNSDSACHSFFLSPLFPSNDHTEPSPILSLIIFSECSISLIATILIEGTSNGQVTHKSGVVAITRISISPSLQCASQDVIRTSSVCYGVLNPQSNAYNDPVSSQVTRTPLQLQLDVINPHHFAPPTPTAVAPVPASTAPLNFPSIEHPLSCSNPSPPRLNSETLSSTYR